MNESGKIDQHDPQWDAEVERLLASIEAGEQFEAWRARIRLRESGLERACRQAEVPGCVRGQVPL